MIENLEPQQAWAFLQQNPSAVLIDVRSKVEHAFVGHPPGAIHIAWKEAPGWQVNPDFVNEVRRIVSNPATPILLLCRSAQRSLDAGRSLEAVGYQKLINIAQGFEGQLDQNKHRGFIDGWRFHGLPWEQS
jgi:rhodanese-related sulfurtransferase